MVLVTELLRREILMSNIVDDAYCNECMTRSKYTNHGQRGPESSSMIGYVAK